MEFRILESKPDARLLQSEVMDGLKHYTPSLTTTGAGGTYTLKDSKGEPIAIFKPQMEDPLSANNPKKVEKSALHFNGLQPGVGIYREKLAYALDEKTLPEEFKSNVQPTYIAELKHWVFTGSTDAVDLDGIDILETAESYKLRKGSLQKYVKHDSDAEDYGDCRFSVHNVHTIALLDTRILNCDRHAGNILVSKYAGKDSVQLIPIDHAFSLPEYEHLDDLHWFEWMSWKQAKVPISAGMREFILNMDTEKDVEIARTYGISEKAIVSLRLASILLKKAVSHGKTFYEIGKLMCSSPTTPSLLKRACTHATTVSDPMAGPQFYQVAADFIEKEL